MDSSNIFQVGGVSERTLHTYLKTGSIGARVQFSAVINGTPMKPVMKCNESEATGIIFPASIIPLIGFAPLGMGIIDGVFLVMHKNMSYQTAVQIIEAYLGFSIDPVPIKVSE